MNDAAAPTTATPALTRAEHQARMAAYGAAGEPAPGHRQPGPGPLRRRRPAPSRDPRRLLGARLLRLRGRVSPAEVAELRAGAAEMLERAPVRQGADVDAKDDRRSAATRRVIPIPVHQAAVRPVGRHRRPQRPPPVQDDRARPDAGAPDDVVYLMFGMCQACRRPAALRPPDLLAIAEAVNGPDFVPYNDAIFVKQPGVGGSVAWHQDGVTHWDKPDWDAGIHGFNFQVQLYPTTAANGLWVVPGTHRSAGSTSSRSRGQRRQRPAARRRPAALRRGRRHDRQPADPPRLLRQHLARHPRLGHLRLPPPPLGARRAARCSARARARR